ncbi:MAG: tetraacyldisaccharide 4'-kinase [Alphaproteobacteria bacterium]|nr:tetraacyldisaccharide 4'-kinase [Alphaproteobacteria bacterium]
MRAPDFWRHDGAAVRLLAPAAALYAGAGRLRWALTRPWRAPVPVVCVGNVVAGGAGKTPVALALARRLAARGRAVHVLGRGYGGCQRGPLRVDPGRHDARAVGDEALLLARAAPAWIARDRRAGVAAAAAAGAALVILDDGFQDPAVVKDLSLLVIDGGYRFGNGRVIPAGPLREPVARALARADALVVIDGDGTPAGFAGAVLRASIEPAADLDDLAGAPVFAFAGIGRPEKFFAMLRRLGVTLDATRAFPDHHVYTVDQIMTLVEDAARLGARPVTTEKDWVRLPEDARVMVTPVPVTLRWHDEAALDHLLARPSP